jgi:hypothetical protein
MTRKEIKSAIRKAATVYAWVNLVEDGDGCYIQVTKSNLLLNCQLDTTYHARMDGCDLYLN